LLILVALRSLGQPRFWLNALANLLGSLGAGLVIWAIVTKLYELPKRRKDVRGLLAVSYGLVRREMDAAHKYCEEYLSARSGQISASGPITQAWDTLHSMGAFQHFSARLSEKLVKYYSLLFRLKDNVELGQKLFLSSGGAITTRDNTNFAVQDRLRTLAKGICEDLINFRPSVLKVLDDEILKLGKREAAVYTEAYEQMPTRP